MEATDVQITAGELEKATAALLRRAEVFAARVAPIYAVMQWRWSRGAQPDQVPDAKEIQRCLVDLIHGAIQTSHGIETSTGGLTAYIYKAESGDVSYGFRFDVSDDGDL
jgi:hypothetical protein